MGTSILCAYRPYRYIYIDAHIYVYVYTYEREGTQGPLLQTVHSVRYTVRLSPLVQHHAGPVIRFLLYSLNLTPELKTLSLQPVLRLGS